MLFLSILILSSGCQASPAHNLGRWEPGWSRRFHRHQNHQHRSPGLSFSMMSSGSSFPNPFDSFLNMKSSSPPFIPLYLPNPFFSKSTCSNVKDKHHKLPGNWLDEPTKDVEIPFSSLLESILTPFAEMGSMITSGLKEIKKDLIPGKDSIKTKSHSPTQDFDQTLGGVFTSIFRENTDQKEEEIKHQETETLDDVFNKIFGIPFHIIPVRQQFVTQEDKQDALVTDAIKEEDVDLDEMSKEEEDFPDSVQSDMFFETLNAIINPKFTVEEDTLASTQNNNFYETLDGIINRPKEQDVLEEVEHDVMEEVEEEVVDEPDVVEKAEQKVVEEVEQADVAKVQQVVIEEAEKDVVEQAEQDVLEEAKQDAVKESEHL